MLIIPMTRTLSLVFTFHWNNSNSVGAILDQNSSAVHKKTLLKGLLKFKAGEHGTCVSNLGLFVNYVENIPINIDRCKRRVE